ncbi:MAG: preprotein translocase subunit SecG [Oscillospiraceae bacterium]|nr:preprotein translocase subunit SecG [Oscillospiraceae bacterium]MDD7293932.1 preprotein translocase subunit SecG [Oscillospiraceae bacterium]MDY2510087.1 preprotein translocase subunit SecG [Ruminococcus callidus]
MGVLEIVIGAVLLLIGVLTMIVCMMQEQKPQNATAALTGASNDSFYDKNRGRTKEARLRKITTILTVLFFALILFIDIVMPLILK